MDIANVVVFLASEQSGFVTGQTINDLHHQVPALSHHQSPG